MKKFVLFVIMFVVAITAAAQTKYEKQGDTYHIVSFTGGSGKTEPTKTKFTVEKNGTIYPVYVSSTGSCFILKVSSKTGKEYRQYLGPEISADICRQLNIEYKPKKGTK